jgi:phosphate transport system permease protein
MLEGGRSAIPPPTTALLRAAEGRLLRARPSGASERSERTNEGETVTITTVDSIGGGAARDVTAGLTSRHTDVREKVIEGVLIATLAASLLILAVLIADMIQRSWSVWTDRGTSFLTSGLSITDASEAGVWPGIKGTIVLMILVVAMAFPLGIACAVYLEEYAGKSGFARWTRVNVRNLAGVPSVVYGLLGLGIFVKVLNSFGEPSADLQDSGFLPFRWLGNALDWVSGNNGRNVIAGGLVLTALVLPIVIITTMEALRAVPRAIREGALGVGATQWETIRHHVLPAASPGILTGTVLALARAAGEAAPILIIGAVTGTLITGDQDFFEQLSGPFTGLPAVIFSYARLPGDEFRAITAAAALVLLVLVLLMNGFALWLRNRYERKW